MNKILIAVVAVVGAVLMGGCVADAKTPAAVTRQAVVTPSPTLDHEAMFIVQVRDHYPELDSQTDASLIHLAHAACDALDTGTSWADVISLLIVSVDDESLQAPLAGTLGAGVAYFCPSHNAEIQKAGV